MSDFAGRACTIACHKPEIRRLILGIVGWLDDAKDNPVAVWRGIRRTDALHEPHGFVRERLLGGKNKMGQKDEEQEARHDSLI